MSLETLQLNPETNPQNIFNIISDVVELEAVEVQSNDEFGFDFAAWEAEVADIDLEEQAIKAFDGLLTFETDDNETARTIEDIQNDIVTFMSNPEVMEMQRVIEYAAVQFAQFCNHNHVGADSMNENVSSLFNASEGLAGQEDHSHKLEHEHDDDDDDTDSKKKKKKRSSWWR